MADDTAPLGSGHHDLVNALAAEDVPFGGTDPVDEPCVQWWASIPPRHPILWSLVAQDARYEPERTAHFELLDEIVRERRIEEMREAARNFTPSNDEMTTEEALSRLQGVRRANVGWRARCPVHGSKGGTLRVFESTTKPGTPNFYCHAGCDWRAVRAALTRS